MIEEIKIDYIKEAISELDNTIGVRQPIKLDQLPGSLNDTSLLTSISKIANFMGLSVKVNVKEVPVGYTAPGSAHQFTTRSIVKTKEDGSTEGITAQVRIPSGLPLYGTPQFNNFPIDVFISDSCKDNPEAFYAIIAHELGHLVLRSIFHPKSDNEVYTDLTAMMLGSLEISKEGRKVISESYDAGYIRRQTTTYGYLSDRNFEYAYGHIKRLVEQYFKEYGRIKSFVVKNKKKVEKIFDIRKSLSSYLSLLDSYKDKKIKNKDANIIIGLHSPNRFDSLDLEIKDTENKLGQLEKIVLNTKFLNKKKIEQLNNQANDTFSQIDSLYKNLEENMRVIKRNLYLKDKILILIRELHK